MSKDNGNKLSGLKLICNFILSSINIYILISAMSKGYEKLDIPNYPINIDSPAISDGDDKIVSVDFSFVRTNDGKSHFCYEMNINGVVNYYDVKEKKLIDKSTIDARYTQRFEDEVRKQVPLDKNGYGDPKLLDQVVSSTIEQYGVKVLVKKKNN